MEAVEFEAKMTVVADFCIKFSEAGGAIVLIINGSFCKTGDEEPEEVQKGEQERSLSLHRCPLLFGEFR